MSSLGKEKFNRYVIEGGQQCPFCSEETLRFEDLVVDNCMAHQRIKCNSCGKEWEDRYVLASVEFEEDTEKVKEVEVSRVIRGGSYSTSGISASVAYRHHVCQVGLRVINAGLRVVRRAK